MTTLRTYGRSAMMGVLAAMCSACATTAVTPVGSAQEREARPENRQTAFESAEAALQALIKATAEKNKAELRALFGPKSEELHSGDEVQDANDFENFAIRLEKASRLVPEDDDTIILHIGVEDHPFPVPLAKANGRWFFDTEAGLEEILNRRIGENEIRAIQVCRGYVVAQQEYVLEDHDADRVAEYAQRLPSTPGQRDGLFWDAGPDEPQSPLGPLVAEARAEGYGRDGATDDGPRPYHGYVYRILTRQGAHAPGGRFDYVVNGNMVAGFALIAYPVEWGSSGVMTFIVNSNGSVLQKDLRERTAELASRIDVYDPDDSWTPAED